MAEKPNYKRRTLIVNDDAQRRMILSVSLMPVIALMLAAVGVAILTRNLVDEAAAVETDLPSLEYLLIWVHAFVALFGILVVRQVTILSHRVCGPNVRILEAMRRIRAGDIGFRISLRKGDFNTEVAAATNVLLDWLNEHPPVGVEITDDATRAKEAAQGEQQAKPEETAAAGAAAGD